MKQVLWTDEKGYQHRSLLRDSDPDHLAPQGIPQDPPDLSHLDWEELKRALHNELVDRGLSTWSDVQRSQDGVSAAVTKIFKRPLVGLYKLEANQK